MTTQLQPGSPEWLRREAAEYDEIADITGCDGNPEYIAGLRAAAGRIEVLSDELERLCADFEAMRAQRCEKLVPWDPATQARLQTLQKEIECLQNDKALLKSQLSNCELSLNASNSFEKQLQSGRLHL